MKFIIFIMTFAIAISSQQIATMPDGKKIEVFEDGTWKSIDTTTTKNQLTCEDLIDENTDKMTNESYKSSGPIYVSKDQKKGFMISILQLQSSRGLIVSIKVVGESPCIDDDAKINILFTDNTRLELKHDGDFNCKNDVTIYFGGAFGKSDILKQLKEKKISTMRIWTIDGFVEEDFSTENMDIFNTVINCLN